MVCPNCGNQMRDGLDRCPECLASINPMRPIVDPEAGAEHFGRFLRNVGKRYSESWVTLTGTVLIGLLFLVPLVISVVSKRGRTFRGSTLSWHWSSVLWLGWYLLAAGAGELNRVPGELEQSVSRRKHYRFVWRSYCQRAYNITEINASRPATTSTEETA